MKDAFLVIVLFQVILRAEGDWTPVLNMTRTGEGDIFTERTVYACTAAWNGYCTERRANRLTWREAGGRQVCMCQCYTWFNTYLSDEDSCKNVPADSDCEWKFEDEGQTLYMVTPGAGQTGRIDWGEEDDWPGSGVTPNSCSVSWSCDVTSQTYLQDGEWKDLSCLGGDIPDDVFVLDYEEYGRKRTCQRHWFVSWDVSYDVTRLAGLVIHLDITCTRRRWSNRQYIKSQCLSFKTEGTHLYTPGPGCTLYTVTTPSGRVTTTQRDQHTIAPETPEAGVTTTHGEGIITAPGSETTHANTTSGNGDMGRNSGAGGGNTAAVAGGVAVAVIAVLVLVGGFVFFWRRKHKQNTGKPSSGGSQVTVSTLQNPGYRVHISAPLSQNVRISSDSTGYVDNASYVGYNTGGSVDNAIYEGNQPEYAYTDVVVPSAPKRDATYQPYQPYDQVPQDNLYSSPNADNVYTQLDGTQERQVPSAPPLPYTDPAGTNHYTSLLEGQENVYQDLGPQYEELPAFSKGTDSDPSVDKSKSPFL
ncbi:uncharacterized protein LOC144912256 [Branchiostoma floridae x Branchiostoma belcheri]